MDDKFKAWADRFGLLNPEKNTPTENAILVTLEYELLKKQKPNYTVAMNEKYFRTSVEGLYTQTHYGKKADHGEEGLEPNSHDNITAQITAYKLCDQDEKVQQMWDYIKRNFFTYDFRSPNTFVKERILHPRDIIYYGHVAGNILCTLMLPLLYLMLIHSCMKPVNITSGKLLWYVRNHCLPGIFKWTFDKLVDTKVSFEIYYHQEGHPIKELL